MLFRITLVCMAATIGVVAPFLSVPVVALGLYLYRGIK